MSIRVEVTAEKAIEAVASLPWHGQIAEKIYTAKRPVGNNRDIQVSLVAVWEGAERLAAGDPTFRCIVLERNPNLVGFRDAITLRIDQEVGGGITRLDYAYRKEGAPVIEECRRPLVQTILGNIIQLAAQP